MVGKVKLAFWQTANFQAAKLLLVLKECIVYNRYWAQMVNTKVNYTRPPRCLFGSKFFFPTLFFPVQQIESSEKPEV